MAEPGSTKPSRRSSASRSSGRFSSASRTMIDSGRGRPSGRRATAPKSSTSSRPSSSSWKLPGCGSACSRPAARRRRVVQLGQQHGGVVALGLGARADDVGELPAGDPLRDHRLRRRRDDLRHAHLVVAREGGREGALVGRLVAVVQLLLHAIAQLRDQRLDLQAGHERLQHAAHARQLPQVGAQRLLGARVLHLDGDRRARRATRRGAPGRCWPRRRASRRTR